MDVPPEGFTYFKTRGGNWAAAASDPQGRMFVIDQRGDLFYDTGDPQIGAYAVSAAHLRRPRRCCPQARPAGHQPCMATLAMPVRM